MRISFVCRRYNFWLTSARNKYYTGLVDDARQLVLLTSVPFGVNQQGEAVLESQLRVGRQIAQLTLKFVRHRAETHRFERVNRVLILIPV